jgi:hypothetical protein
MAANRNFTHNSNFFFQTNLFTKDETSYAVQECNLPGLNFSHIQISKNAVFGNEQGDTISYNDLNISLIIDENLVVWKDIITSMQNMRNPVTTEGEEYMKYGYLIIQDDNTNQIIKLEFIDMFIESIDDMTFNTNSEDEIITCTVTIKYDYYVVH